MSSKLRKLNDKFSKETLSYPETGQNFVKNYLPIEIVHKLLLPSLEVRKTSYIDPELREVLSDVLYRLKTVDKDDVYIFVLIEHKSKQEPLVGLQIMKYLVRIWEEDVKEGKKKLSVIVPVVLYHGKRAWTVSIRFRDLFDVPEGADRFIPNYEYLLMDLSQYKDEEIKGEARLEIMLLLLKYIYREDLGEELPKILDKIELIDGYERKIEYLKTVLIYLASATNDREAKGTLNNIIKEKIKKGDEIMGTLLDDWKNNWRKEGERNIIEKIERRDESMKTIIDSWIEEGEKRGIYQGINQGINQGMSTIVLKQAKKKFGRLENSQEQQIYRMTQEELELLAENLLTAKTIEDLFTINAPYSSV